jgi:hypothetical protein
MMNPLDRLKKVSEQADSGDEKRRAFAGYQQAMRNQGWSEADLAEYRESVKILMGKDDAATLALFPAGLYKSADEARADAVRFWGCAA